MQSEKGFLSIETPCFSFILLLPVFILGSSKDQVTDCTRTNKKADGRRKQKPGFSSLYLMPNFLIFRVVSAVRIRGEDSFLLSFSLFASL